MVPVSVMLAASAFGPSALASPKSSTLTAPSGLRLMFAGFEIAMDDALRVRRLERVRDLMRDVQRFGHRHRPARQSLGEILPWNELHHQRLEPVHFLEAVDHADVGMVEGGEHPRLALEAHDVFRIVSERARQDLDGDIASQPGIARAIHLAHAAYAKELLDLEHAEPASIGKRARGGRRHAVVQRVGSQAVEAEQRLDFCAKRGIDVMLYVVGFALDG